MVGKALLKNIPKDQLRGKVVLVRCDYNVPLAETTLGVKVSDESRIKASFPTLAYLAESGARVVLCSHLGRPRGHAEPSLSLKPVAESLDWCGVDITFVSDSIGPGVQDAIRGLADGHMLLLENLRFHSGETDNDEDFVKQLATGVDVYVNDAFGAAHRAHASTVGVAKFIPIKVAGFLMDKELTFLGNALQNPARPLAAVVGGAKVSSKLGVLRHLLDRVDKLLIGGAMVYTFHRALGHAVGDSLVESDLLSEAKAALDVAKHRGVELILAADSLVVPTAALHGDPGTALHAEALRIIASNDAIPLGHTGVDIGPETIHTFSIALSDCKTVIWNGPMGICEKPEYAKGTNALMHCIADLTARGATTIVCGGDTVAAVQREMHQMHQLGGLDAAARSKQAPQRLEFSHLSTGGGAALEFLEGKELPGVAALDDAA